MKRLMNYLRGMVRVRVEGPFPERLINLCAQHRVDFWGVEWEEEHLLRMTVRRRQFRLLGELAERVECEAEAEGSRGLPDFLLRFRRRYAFLLGLALSLWAVMFLSRFVLTIEVTGNQRLPTAVILSALAAVSACGASGVAGGSLLLIPLACSLFGIGNDVAMQVVAIGFIIGVVQDSCETALNSSSDVLFTATSEYREWRKAGKEITFGEDAFSENELA